MNRVHICAGDALAHLRELRSQSVRCCVTSPPYWGLRDYGDALQLGLEESLDEYIWRLVTIMREVRRVLTDDGTLWLNLGDCHAQGRRGGGGTASTLQGSRNNRAKSLDALKKRGGTLLPAGCKPKDLIGVPWRVAFALQADGWWLRSDVIWEKPNCLPESVVDRPTRSHEYVFLLSKSRRYYYDKRAAREPYQNEYRARPKSNPPRSHQPGAHAVHSGLRLGNKNGTTPKPRTSGNLFRKSRADFGGIDDHGARQGFAVPRTASAAGRNWRSVWRINVQALKHHETNYATQPPKLAERCVLAGSRPGDVVLDPFAGSGTTGLAALAHGRDAILIDLSRASIGKMRRRLCLADAQITEIDRDGTIWLPIAFETKR